jgi:steroid 5-alpha reductase family enzyme
MFDLDAFLYALLAILAAGLMTWVFSLRKKDVSIVDSLWSMMFLLAALVYLATAPAPGPRATLVVVMVGLWALRLAAYVTWRNWGEAEDYRYRRIRANNEPNFAVKSLYMVFGLQGVIAWIISLPLLVAIHSSGPLGVLDLLGLALWGVGMFFEAVGDWQLARFKADPENRGKVLDTGLWRYTRHPNYFGNACIWWGLFLTALAADGWWTIVSPLLMTFLLLRVSGVAMLERDIGERRPAYRDYVRRTNAFLPGPPRQAPTTDPQSEARA